MCTFFFEAMIKFSKVKCSLHKNKHGMLVQIFFIRKSNSILDVITTLFLPLIALSCFVFVTIASLRRNCLLKEILKSWYDKVILAWFLSLNKSYFSFSDRVKVEFQFYNCHQFVLVGGIIHSYLKSCMKSLLSFFLIP